MSSDALPAPMARVRSLGARLRDADPGFIGLKSAVRAAIVMPSVFAFAHEVIGDPQTSLFAAFGSFAVLVFAEFGGDRRARLVAYLALAAVGAAFIAVGTLCSRNPWLAAGSTAVIVFGVLFSGVINGYFAAGATAGILLFVLPVTMAAGTSVIPARLEGWALAAGVGICAQLLLWPARPSERLGSGIARACRALADVTESGGSIAPGSEASGDGRRPAHLGGALRGQPRVAGSRPSRRRARCPGPPHPRAAPRAPGPGRRRAAGRAGAVVPAAWRVVLGTPDRDERAGGDRRGAGARGADVAGGAAARGRAHDPALPMVPGQHPWRGGAGDRRVRRARDRRAERLLGGAGDVVGAALQRARDRRHGAQRAGRDRGRHRRRCRGGCGARHRERGPVGGAPGRGPARRLRPAHRLVRRGPGRVHDPPARPVHIIEPVGWKV